MAVLRRVMLLCIFLAAVFSISEQLQQDNGGNVPNQAGAGRPLRVQQEIHQHVQPPHTRHTPLKIADHPACSADVKALCSPNLATNNFAVLECLQNDEKVNILDSVTFNVIVKRNVPFFHAHRSCGCYDHT